MVISIICFIGCLIYAFAAKFPDESEGKFGFAVLWAFLTSILFFVGKFIGVAIYYMIGPTRIVTILLRNIWGVIAFVLFVVLIRKSNQMNLSRKRFLLASLIMTAIVFAEDVVLMLIYRMIMITLLG